VSTVFFLFLLHLSVGMLATLPLVPARAGAKYFKFISAAAAFLTTAGLWLLYRRFGIDGGHPTLGAYRATLGAAAASLLFTIVYNRAQHFAWRRAQGPLLAGALAAGVAAMVAASTASGRTLLLSAAVTSAALLGAAAAAMVLGHWYLVVLDLPIVALRRLTVLLAASLAARTVAVGVALFAAAGAFDAAATVAAGRWNADGIFVWMRLLFGIAGPIALIGFVWKTVEIRSTQSATGILYVQLFLVIAGELLATYLRVSAGYPL
jgi:hypothetical protein